MYIVRNSVPWCPPRGTGGECQMRARALPRTRTAGLLLEVISSGWGLGETGGLQRDRNTFVNETNRPIVPIAWTLAHRWQDTVRTFST